MVMPDICVFQFTFESAPSLSHSRGKIDSVSGFRRVSHLTVRYMVVLPAFAFSSRQ
jgi:hypothetical protein